MNQSSFARLCPLNGFVHECTLNKEEQELLTNLNQHKAFLIYPFKEAKRIAEIIHTLCSQYNIRVYDALVEPGTSIIKSCKICKLILASDFGIAILSPLNYNVMFEIGYLLGLQKNIFYLADTTKTPLNKIPFDISDRMVVPFDGENSLELNFRKEFPDFLKRVGKSTEEKNSISLKNKNISYEYLSIEREDELLLNGSQITTIKIKMLAYADMPGYPDSKSTISEKLFPFSSFDIELLSYKRDGEGSVEFRMIEQTDKKNRFKLIIDPPLMQGEELSFIYRLHSCGHHVMCLEDLIEVAKYEKKYESLMMYAYRIIAEPTRDCYWKFIFPKDYEITNAQPAVARSEKRIKREELKVESEKSFKRFKDNQNRWILELRLKDPRVSFNYGFAWVPPTKDEYEAVCLKHSATPLRCKQ